MRDPNQTTYGPTSGSVSGWAGEVIALVVLIMALTGHQSIETVRVLIATVLAAALIWAFMLRSRVVLRADGVLLRNAFVDTFVPYGRIERVIVRTVTYLFADNKKYVGTGVGRKVRDMVRRQVAGTQPTRPRTSLTNSQVADFMEERILERVKEASPGEGRVSRHPAWLEIAVCAVLAIALILAFVL